MTRLHLEIFINGEPQHLVAEVFRDRAGGLFARRSELKQVGVAVPEAGKDEDLIALEQIPGVGLRFESEAQKLHLSLTEQARAVRDYDANLTTGALPEQKVEMSREFGAVFNYNLYGAVGKGLTNGRETFHTSSVTLDARIFSPIGVLQQSGILGTTLAKGNYLRLDSSFVFAHRDSLTVTTLGDSVSGGLNWTRPIRQGGVQINRQFALRPDLVTAPLPSVSGSAAVPSTVDVFVDNVRVASQQVGSGPFRINNLSVPSEAGSARIVVRDITGKETVTTMPFFTSAKLLGKGYLDFSIDAGFPRLNYALESFDYSKRPFAMGTIRYGVLDWLTLEAHGESTQRLLNGGVGTVIGAGQAGLFALAAAGSWHAQKPGGMVHASWQKNFGSVFLAASTQRTIGRYEDVASVSAANATLSTSQNLNASGYFFLNRSPRMSRAIDRLSIGVPITAWKASLSASFINAERANREKSRLLALSYTQNVTDSANLFISAYADIANRRDAGILAGISFTLGPDLTLTASGAFSRDGRSGGVELTRSLGQKPHDYGWRIFDSEGTNAQRGASGVYRNPWARIEAGVRQDRNQVSGSGEVDGAIVATPSGVFATRRVNDAFAIVDAGAPDVDVLHENRLVGKTGADGKLIVPDLQSHHRSKLAVDPSSVPHDRLLSMTETDVIPGYRGSAIVKVSAMHVNDTARAHLTDASGEAFPVGTRVQHVESGNSYTIGYGSIAYIPRLDEENTLVVQQGVRSCRVVFRKSERSGPKGRVGPLKCRPD